jgi:hypothetical protein
MAFESKVLAGSRRLDQAAAGGASIKPAPPHDDPEAVKRIQKGLQGVGYSLPLSFPNGANQEPDAKYGDETYQAVLDFQKRVFPNDSSQWDGRVGKNTLRELDKMLANGKRISPTPSPTPPIVPSGTCVPMDDTIPAGNPYDLIPRDTMTLLQRSYRERNSMNMNLVDAFEAGKSEACPQSKVSFKVALDRLMKSSSFQVLGEMRSKCEAAAPGIWPKIRWLHEVYNWGSSRGIWCCIPSEDAISIRQQLKSSPRFCSDMAIGQSTHQKGSHHIDAATPSQCYRELGKVGEAGLHICIKIGSSEFGEWHNIHIDPHQIGAAKGKKCSCWYAKTKHHFDDVGRWCVDWFFKNHGNDPKLKAAMALLGVDDNTHAYYAFMQIVGDYDTLVDMADHPERYDKPWDVKAKAKLTVAALYKEAYMNYAPPGYDP